MRLETVGHLLVRLDRCVSQWYCRRRGHAYNFDWTDIVDNRGNPFAPAVWCDRCKRYVPDPRCRPDR